jgi:hypothetical protein
LQPSTNSGLPFLVKKKLVLDEAVGDHPSLLLRSDPSILFHRTQESGKVRDVWGQSIANILEEQAFFQVVLPVLKKLEWRAALNGVDAVEAAVGRCLDTSVARGATIVSVDFSQYDASVAPNASRVALSSICSMFQPSLAERIEAQTERFISGGIVTPDGIYNGEHGVPSGSTWTNEVDSRWHYLVSMSGDVPILASQIQGDDGLHVISGDRDRFLETFTGYGLKVNEDKSHTASDECVYLQCYFHHNDRLSNGAAKAMYPSYRALNRIIHPERWTNLDDELTGQTFFAIRSISILENCKRHPMFRDLVKFVASVTDLSFDNAGLYTYLGRIHSKGDAGILNQHGAIVRGIYNFDTVKVLNELGVMLKRG